MNPITLPLIAILLGIAWAVVLGCFHERLRQKNTFPTTTTGLVRFVGVAGLAIAIVVSVLLVFVKR